MAWDSLVTHDLLEKMLLRTRPYEEEPKDSDELFNRFLDELCAEITPHRDLVESLTGKLSIPLGRHPRRFRVPPGAQQEFARPPMMRSGPSSVSLASSSSVLHDRSNQDLIHRLEREAEVVGAAHRVPSAMPTASARARWR